MAAEALIGDVLVDLSDVPQRPHCFGKTLVAVATGKCHDMVERGYFANVDPDGEGINIQMHRAGYALASYLIEDASLNSFELLNRRWWNATDSNPEPTTAQVAELGRDGITRLAVDADVPSLGHGVHLLGMDESTRRCRDRAGLRNLLGQRP